MASLDLTGHQEDLIKAVHATGTPTVVVLINGRPLSIRWTAENVPAIVEAWFPGERGGGPSPTCSSATTTPAGGWRSPCRVMRDNCRSTTTRKPSKANGTDRMQVEDYVDMARLPRCTSRPRAQLHPVRVQQSDGVTRADRTLGVKCRSVWMS